MAKIESTLDEVARDGTIPEGQNSTTRTGADTVSSEASTKPKRLPTPWVLTLLVAILGYIAHQSPRLLMEFQGLRQDWHRDAHARVIGFHNVHPLVSYAQKPADWFRVEGDSVALWAGWKPGQGHRWFQIDRGDLQRDRLDWAVGRDVIRPIDQPIIELGGGPCWERIPWDALVYGNSSTVPPTAYPALLLEKTQVVNESVHPRPTLVVFSPFLEPDRNVAVFDPHCQGHRLTMGSAGYLYSGHPLLYDRGTESLWVQESKDLVAVSGPLRGERLARTQPLTLSTWSDWRSNYPNTRLVVGADRSQPLPTQ